MIARLWRGVAADAGPYLRHFDGKVVAVVEPEARAVLVEFDDFVRHFEVER